MRWLIKDARLLDPGRGVDRVADLLVEGGKIAKIGIGLSVEGECETIEAAGMVLSPSFIDLHVHLREPGREYAETIESGVRAAAAGGFSAVACMPNTDPPLDNHAMVRYVIDRALKCGPVEVMPIGCITRGRAGERLAEFGEMADAGAVAVSDDGDPVCDSSLMRRALEYAQQFDLPIFTHPEDRTLSRNGVMNEGVVSTRLGLKGIPKQAEEIGIARDIELAALTGGRLHVLHVSSAGGVEIVRRAKERGLNVTAETAPHYLALTDESLAGYDTNRKMNPPLRTSHDREALRRGVGEGVLEVIATDHAPHPVHEKDAEFDRAPFGVLGLETALGVLVTHCVRPGHLTLETVVERLTAGPARVLGRAHAGILEGERASLTLFAPDESWVVDPGRLHSISRNTAFGGERLFGVVKALFLGEEMIPSDQGTSSEDRPATMVP